MGLLPSERTFAIEPITETPEPTLWELLLRTEAFKLEVEQISGFAGRYNEALRTELVVAYFAKLIGLGEDRPPPPSR